MRPQVITGNQSEKNYNLAVIVEKCTGSPPTKRMSIIKVDNGEKNTNCSLFAEARTNQKTTWNSRPPKPDRQESATFDISDDDSVFNSMCTLMTLYQINTYRKYSEPQPFLKHIVRILPDDCAAYGFTLASRSRAAPLPAMADTGCQRCLAGIKVLHRLDLNRSDLIHVMMKMHATNNRHQHHRCHYSLFSGCGQTRPIR